MTESGRAFNLKVHKIESWVSVRANNIFPQEINHDLSKLSQLSVLLICNLVTVTFLGQVSTPKYSSKR